MIAVPALLLACLALSWSGVDISFPRRHRLLRATCSSNPPRLLVRMRCANGPACAQLARPLLPGEHIDLDHADVSEITRLPRVGPALAQRIVAWRTEHGHLAVSAGPTACRSVGPKLLDAIGSCVFFGGSGLKTLTGLAPKHILGLQFQ